MRAIANPFQFFTDTNGDPLDNGKVYIGTSGENPETSALQVYADAAGTIPLAQPLRTVSGRICRYGSPVNVYVNGAYSITVKDKNGVLVYNCPDVSEVSAASGATNAVDDLGAINDGTGDNSAIFNAAFTNNSYIFLPAGTYNVDSLVSINAFNLTVVGVKGATIITSATLQNIINLITLQHCVFKDISFQTSKNDPVQTGGVVYGNDPTILNTVFDGCEFKSPAAATCGMLISGAGSISDFSVSSCNFENIGWYGLYVQGTAKNVKIKDNTFYNVKTSCIHVSGVSHSEISGNTFDALSSACDTITSDADSGVMTGNVIAGNRTLSRPTDGGLILVSNTDTVLSDNVLDLSQAVEITNCLSTKWTSNMIDATSANAVIVSGTSTNNEFVGGRISNADAPTSASNVTVLNTGASVAGTRLVSVELYKETAGALVDGASGAPDPLMYFCGGDGDTGSGDYVKQISGTWTPTVLFATMTDVAYTSNGWYVKTGKLVTIMFDIIFTNKGSGSSSEALFVDNLPYSGMTGSGALDAGGGALSWWQGMAASTKCVTARVETNLPKMLFEMDGTTDMAQIHRSDITNSTILRGVISYLTD